jgi:hypothetical protein
MLIHMDGNLRTEGDVHHRGRGDQGGADARAD